MAALTARDIAKYVQRPGESPTVAMDRVRNWAKMGLIKPIGEKHPGRGKSKKYNTAALLGAVLLQTLTDTFGSSATSLQSLVSQISKIVRHGAHPGVKSSRHDPTVLVLSRPHGADALSMETVRVADLGKYLLDSDLNAHMVLNMGRLFSGLPINYFDILPEMKAEIEALIKSGHVRTRAIFPSDPEKPIVFKRARPRKTKA